MTQSATSAEPSCLSEEDVLAFAAGQLSLEGLERAHLHLDACDECQQLLNEAVRGLATARTAGQGEAGHVAWGTTFRPGMVVGHRYEIRRFIARGGMGEVYEAFDQELQQRVALKTVTATAGDNPSAVRRLKAEVQLARRVSHANVCRIYDFGTHQATLSSPPLAFLTMEFVEGETLGDRLRRSGPLPVADALALARSLLSGLAAAHAAGVLHRDFKSDNVVLRSEGERLEPFILDFGLARALDHSDPQSNASGRGLVGTLAYMAPEQLEGLPYTTATDIYSFGLVWFEMLTGELPFKVRSSPTVTTLERLTKPVPPPSSQNPLVPPELDALVLACLRRCSGDRPQTATAVLSRLESLGQEKEPKPQRRALGALVVSALAASVVTLALLQGVQREPPPARPSPMLPSREGSALRALPGPRPPASLAPPAAPASSAALATRKPGAPPPVAIKSKGRASAPPAPMKATPAEATPTGWENPFPTGSVPPSSALGAVLDQPLDGRASARHTELPEGRSELIGNRAP